MATKAKTPNDRLKVAAQQLLSTVGERVATSVTDKVSSTAKRLNDYADGTVSDGVKKTLIGAGKLAEGKSVLSAAVSTGLATVQDKVKRLFGGKRGKSGKPKVTNIVENIDVGVSVEVAYAQWTGSPSSPAFMKHVENVEQLSDKKLEWKAHVLWSHRTWESTIQEQVPNERIVWRSKGAKGHVDGAVTFHEIAPQLTRIVLVLEYHPQGLFERTGNIWRAQGRRARLELKHFRRHVMTNTILHTDELEGWPGEIRDGEVVDNGAATPDDADLDEEPTPRPKRRKASPARKSSTGKASGSRTRTSDRTRTGGRS